MEGRDYSLFEPVSLTLEKYPALKALLNEQMTE